MVAKPPLLPPLVWKPEVSYRWQAAGRRDDLMVQEENSRREAEAYFSAYVRGRGGRRSAGVRWVVRGGGGGS